MESKDIFQQKREAIQSRVETSKYFLHNELTWDSLFASVGDPLGIVATAKKVWESINENPTFQEIKAYFEKHQNLKVGLLIVLGAILAYIAFKYKWISISTLLPLLLNHLLTQ